MVYENVYQVERVLNVRKQKVKLEFETKWLGCQETTWEPKQICREKILSFFSTAFVQCLLCT